MGRYFALALNAGNLNPKPKTVSSRPKFNFRIKNPGMIIAAALFVLAVSYLLQVNSVSTKGYNIEKLEQRIAELKQQGEHMELEARSLRAIDTIEGEAQILNLVPTSEVNYASGNGYAFGR